MLQVLHCPGGPKLVAHSLQFSPAHPLKHWSHCPSGPKLSAHSLQFSPAHPSQALITLSSRSKVCQHTHYSSLQLHPLKHWSHCPVGPKFIAHWVQFSPAQPRIHLSHCLGGPKLVAHSLQFFSNPSSQAFITFYFRSKVSCTLCTVFSSPANNTHLSHCPGGPKLVSHWLQFCPIHPEAQLLQLFPLHPLRHWSHCPTGPKLVSHLLQLSSVQPWEQESQFSPAQQIKQVSHCPGGPKFSAHVSQSGSLHPCVHVRQSGSFQPRRHVTVTSVSFCRIYLPGRLFMTIGSRRVGRVAN